MSWTSVAPAALAELKTLADTLASDTLAVLLGPVVSASSKREALCLAWSDEQTTAIENGFDGGRLVPDAEEAAVINCMVHVLVGDAAKIVETIDRAYQILGEFADLVNAADFDDTVMECYIATAACSLSQEPVGLVAALPFGVAVRGYTGV